MYTNIYCIPLYTVREFIVECYVSPPPRLLQLQQCLARGRHRNSKLISVGVELALRPPKVDSLLLMINQKCMTSPRQKLLHPL